MQLHTNSLAKGFYMIWWLLYAITYPKSGQDMWYVPPPLLHGPQGHNWEQSYAWSDSSITIATSVTCTIWGEFTFICER